ncbi:MAG: helix-turn-helix domain-containing protein [Planctomycetes bacterium]|nr:helix-turn-helix domain-containing protein [Planctomycetota bacterium]
MALISGHLRAGSGFVAEATQKHWALTLVIQGTARIRLPDGEFISRAGEVHVSEPDLPVSWNVPEDSLYEPVWFVFNPPDHLLPLLRLPVRLPGLRSLYISSPERRRRVCEALLRAHELATGPQGLCEDLALTAIHEALLWCREEMGTQVRALDSRVEAAQRYLHQHMAEAIRIPDVVAACHLSRARLLCLFRKQTGVSMIRYLETERMRRAGRLLASGFLPVKVIAREVGYEDPRYFSRRFKNVMGCQPSELRKAKQEEMP